MSQNFHSQRALQQATAHHQAGQLPQAERIYKEILEAEPKNADALHLLGVLACQSRQPEVGADLITKAIQVNPNQPTFYSNLGNALNQQGKLDEAIAAYRRALAIDPDYADAHYNLGNTLRDKTELDEAILAYQRVVEIKPNYLDGHYNLGNALLEQGNLDEAIAAYRRALDIDPGFAKAHANLGTALLGQGNLDEAIASCQRALEIDPSYAEVYNNVGIALNEQRKSDQAIIAFRRALEIDSSYTEAQKNLKRTLNRKIPRWHFSMLADSSRNEAYQRAIEKAVNESSRVLDIGTGSGLLALMAAEAGAAKVTACEMSKRIAEVAQQVVMDNDFANVVTVIDKKSPTLKVGIDLKERANVLVCEIFDAGLLGEGVIPTLRHALRNLVTQDAKVIPQAASIYGELVEIPRLRAVSPVSTICGFNLSAFDRFRNPNECTTVYLRHETYRVLTEPFEVVKFDFRNPPAYASESNPHQVLLEEPAIAEGNVHAIALWFDLCLDDDIRISTGPAGELIHWGQVLQFFDRGMPVKKGQKIKFTVSHSDTLIWFDSLTVGEE